MDYTVWIEVLSGLMHTYNILALTPLADAYKKYALGIVSTQARAIGWDKRTNEDHTTTMLRSSLLFHAGFYGDKEILAHAKKLFLASDREPIDADVRTVVYNLVAIYGSKKEYDALLSMYHYATAHEEKNRLMHSLGQFESPALLSRTLALGLSKEVRLQDRNSVFASVLGNPAGRDLAWSFLKKNWPKLIAEYGEGGHLLARLVKPLNHFVDKKDADDIKKFFKKNKAPAASRTVDQVLENIYSNDAWKKRDMKSIGEWLKSH